MNNPKSAIPLIRLIFDVNGLRGVSKKHIKLVETRYYEHHQKMDRNKFERFIKNEIELFEKELKESYE